MGNYNFEDNNYEFDETVRLDSINKEVRIREELEETSEFEPIKAGGNRPSGGKKKMDKGKESLFSDNIVKLSILGGVVVFAFMFVVVFMFVLDKKPDAAQTIVTENQPESTGTIPSSKSIYAVVLSNEKNKTFKVYDIEQESSITIKVADDTILIGGNGGKISTAEYKAGDVISVTFGENSEVKEISVPSDIWRFDSATGVEVNDDQKSILYEDKIYGFGNETIFIAEGATMFPGDVSKADTVTMIGKDNKVYSLSIVTGHGLVVFKNIKIVDDLEVLIDDKPIEIDEENGIAEVGCGTRKMTIKGRNLSEDYITVITVDQKERLSVDLAEALETAEKGIIQLKVNQSGYSIYVDGVIYTDHASEVVVEKGSHKIQITKSGFETWSTNLTVGDRTEILNVTLKVLGSSGGSSSGQQEVKKGNLTINSNPSWAKIYVDGNYIGISPVMVSLDYGEHYVEAELDGFDISKEYVTINSSEKTVKIKLD